MRALLRLVILFAALAMAAPAGAAITFSLRTGNSSTMTQSMPIDSNQCSTNGPRAMYVGGVITNSGATTATNITAAISGLGSGFFLAGGQPATQSIGALDPGQSTGVYWFIGYGCTNLASTTVAITISSSTGTSTSNVTLTARAALSANAGGQVTSSTLGPGAVVGQTIYFDSTYSFGGSVVGDEFFLQPSGAQSFDASCFRLVGSQILSSTITPIVPGTTDQLYFVQTVKQAGSSYTATVRYFLQYECANASTTAQPYAVQTSGNTNIKYTGNFNGLGSLAISFPGASNPFQISKTSDTSTGIAGASTIVKYTITITNPSAYSSRISQIVDTLPTGVSFAAIDPASDVTAANSSSVPTAGATGTIAFVGRQDQSYIIAAGGTVRLIYTVTMPPTAGTYVNSAQGYFGSATTGTASATFTVVTPTPLLVVKSSQPSTDPVNGTTNPKLIPGGRVLYTISISNPNGFSVTSNSIVVTDATPANMQLYVADIGSAGSGPVSFVDGTTPSTLTYSFAGLASTTDNVDFSKDGGVTWTYVPVPDSRGVDPLVTHIRIRPQGAMAAGSSFRLLFAYVIK